ncbi:hypothetical protein ACVMH6_000193 [Rhizobium leguminosarum]
MAAHGRNPILDLYGTAARHDTITCVGARQGHADTFRSGRPGKKSAVQSSV